MSTIGRPLALTPTKAAELCALVASGVTLQQAARHVGCCLQTVRRHARRDAEFKRQLKSARTAAPVEPLRLVRQAAGSHWRAAAWLLERTEPDRYAARPASSCRLEQIEDLVATMLEAAVSAVPSRDQELQYRVYNRVNQTAQEGLSKLFPAGRKPFKSRVCTPQTDRLRLFEELGVFQDDVAAPDQAAKKSEPRPPQTSDAKEPAPLSDRPIQMPAFRTAQKSAAANEKEDPLVAMILKELAKALNETLPPELQIPSLWSPKIDVPEGVRNELLLRSPPPGGEG